MLRYLRRLADRDYALDRGMIPLGSCTMKLNATTEMEPVTWPEFGALHPFRARRAGRGVSDADPRAGGAAGRGHRLRQGLPPAQRGLAQGELAGLLAVRAYHRANGEPGRTVCLIPSSAHGTNAASAVMAGMTVVVVKTSDNGDVDVADLHAKIEQHGDELAVLMVTYPSTHGVFEEHITEVCAAVHDAGGQVYVDGANLNALLGLAKPGRFGADVSHLNLHKTFCIPHGGGGPGVGPIGGARAPGPVPAQSPAAARRGARDGDRPGLRGAVGIGRHPAHLLGVRPADGGRGTAQGHPGGGAERQLHRQAAGAALSGALRGPARTGGARVHHRRASADQADRCEHRRCRQAADRLRVPRADDVLPRRRDADDRADGERGPRRGRPVLRGDDRHSCGDREGRYGGVGRGGQPAAQRPAHGRAMLGREWQQGYGREEAVFPAGVHAGDKYWPPVRRIDGAYGDRNLVCSCPPIAEYDAG